MKKFVKCKKLMSDYEDFFTVGKMYEVRYGKTLGKDEIIVITNYNTQLVVTHTFSKYFYTEQELRKMKIDKLLNGEKSTEV